ncbi:MAG: extracellular catalytic domain type 1 short-chain-length polyhydroxyalkanoate depolymerase, partial [Beijerinckiaceae bacterium]
AIPEGARFLSRRFSCDAGARNYRLYIPASAPRKPKGLIVMLHGCTQNPDDFAAGTNMNALAETHGLLVAYPAQTRAQNPSSCWNWFDERHQLRDAGEPAIIAGLAEALVAEFGIDRKKVFAAGLSAGGAMAVIVGQTYPELFSAVGVHSGLAYRSAGNVMSALSVMRGDAGAGFLAKRQASVRGDSSVRTIIFQGSADRTVHPSNAERIASALSGANDNRPSSTTSGAINGRTFRRTVVADAQGGTVVESWLIDGAGHAWSGGEASGSYADPKGPAASREMVRFFLEQP